MIVDAIKYAQSCKACQIHADFIHQPPELLHPTVASWPFEAWGINIVGPISPSLTKGHKFILVMTDYFSKCVEAIPLIEVKTSNVVNFVKHHIIHQFSRRNIHEMVPILQAKYSIGPAINTKIQNVASTAYSPAANILTEAFNKTIIKLLKKFILSNE